MCDKLVRTWSGTGKASTASQANACLHDGVVPKQVKKLDRSRHGRPHGELHAKMLIETLLFMSRVENVVWAFLVGLRTCVVTLLNVVYLLLCWPSLAGLGNHHENPYTCHLRSDVMTMTPRHLFPVECVVVEEVNLVVGFISHIVVVRP